MLKVVVKEHTIQIGDRFMLSLQRTLRVPNDGKTYPLPPGLGVFPIYKAADFTDSIPPDWNRDNSFFIPMYQREALWLGFAAADWKPNAVKIELGKVNAVSGESESDSLQGKPQNYLVCPQQLWLDGINSGKNAIRQFVAMPLGLGVTVEANISDKEEFGAIQITVFEPKAGVFPDQAPEKHHNFVQKRIRSSAMFKSFTMGLAAGGQIKQKIYPDPYGIDVWDSENFGEATIHIVNSELFHEICGQKPPPTPVDAAAYTKKGFPWFDLYDENKADLAAPENLTKVKSLEDDDVTAEVNINDSQIKKLSSKKTLKN